jgi:hypothetical protein
MPNRNIKFWIFFDEYEFPVCFSAGVAASEQGCIKHSPTLNKHPQYSRRSEECKCEV